MMSEDSDDEYFFNDDIYLINEDEEIKYIEKEEKINNMKALKSFYITKEDFNNIKNKNKGSFINLNFEGIEDIHALIIKSFKNKLIVEVLPITNELITIKTI